MGMNCWKIAYSSKDDLLLRYDEEDLIRVDKYKSTFFGWFMREPIAEDWRDLTIEEIVELKAIAGQYIETQGRAANPEPDNYYADSFYVDACEFLASEEGN